MRRLLALWITTWLAAACVAGGATTPAPTPAPPASAEVSATRSPVSLGDREDRTHEAAVAGPDAGARPPMGLSPAGSPPNVRSISILSPAIATVPTRFAVVPMSTRAANTSELEALRQPVGSWIDQLIAMFERRRHPQPGVDPELDLRNTFTDQRVAQVVVKSLAGPDITGVPALTLTGWQLDGALMRAWGTPAYVDVTIRVHDKGPYEDRALSWRMRLQPIGFWHRVIDLYDASSGSWLIGEAPRYTALELDAELRWAAEAYLGNESFSSFRPSNAAIGGADTAFSRVRTEALNALNGRVAAGALAERYFENVTARIERFEPAWFGGDGVVTVTLRGRLVETIAGGKQVTSDFTQRLKFLRTFDFWTAVDAQEQDGSWDSGGNLALAEVARPHG
jgi:hypothetical protein